MAKKKKKNNKLGSDAGFNKKLWWIVAAACLLLIAGAVLLQLNRQGAFKPRSRIIPADEVNCVKPPVRAGEELITVSPKVAKGMTLKNAVEQSEAVLLVRVGDWLGETEDKTLYECTVLEALKGDVGEKFVLAQDGNSKRSISGYPLFTGGNELLAFLVPSEATLDKLPRGEKVYEFTGSYTTMFYSTMLETGDDRYLVTLYDGWLDRMPREIVNMGSLSSPSDSVFEVLTIQDAVWEKIRPEYRIVYDYAALAKQIRSLL